MLKQQVKQWERELREEGMREGIEKGIEKGKTKGELELVLELLEDKFGTIPEEYRDRVNRAGSEQLVAWAKRILSAEKIDDVFEP